MLWAGQLNSIWQGKGKEIFLFFTAFRPHVQSNFSSHTEKCLDSQQVFITIKKIFKVVTSFKDIKLMDADMVLTRCIRTCKMTTNFRPFKPPTHRLCINCWIKWNVINEIQNNEPGWMRDKVAILLHPPTTLQKYFSYPLKCMSICPHLTSEELLNSFIKFDTGEYYYNL